MKNKDTIKLFCFFFQMSDEWADELVALQSIYDNLQVISETCIEIPFKGEFQECSLRVELTKDYPQQCPNFTLQEKATNQGF